LNYSYFWGFTFYLGHSVQLGIKAEISLVLYIKTDAVRVCWLVGPSIRSEEGGCLGDSGNTVHLRDGQDAVRRDERNEEYPRRTASAGLPLVTLAQP